MSGPLIWYGTKAKLLNSSQSIADFCLEQLSADPVTVLFNGRTYYNTTTHKVRAYVNSAWVNLDASSVVTQSTSGLVLSAGQLLGTNTNDNASAGYVGEYKIESRLRSASTASSNGASQDVTASPLNLTAGEWDIYGVIEWDLTSATVTEYAGSISKTPGTLSAVNTLAVPTDGEVRSAVATNLVTSSDDYQLILPVTRVKLAASDDFYLVANITFSAGTVAVFGSIYARRVR